MLDRPTLEALAAQLLPGHKPYVVASSERPTGGDVITRRCFGVTGPSVDVVFADWLRHQGRWQGRKPCVFLDDLALLDEHRQRILGIWTHEMGHLADFVIEDSAEPTELSATMAELTSQFCDINADAFKIPEWTSHDASWIRRCLHLRYRLGLVGHHFGCWAIYNAEQYGLPPCESFDNRLGGVFEYECLARVPIGELDQFPPPFLFRQLWHDWLDWWEQKNPDLTPHARGIVDRGRSLYPRRLEHEHDW